MTATKDKTIYEMCMTWRHDFGLEKRQYSIGSSGVTPEERDALIRDMSQIYSHHIQPIVDDLEKAREVGAEFASLAERRREEIEVLRKALQLIREESSDLGACERAADALVDSKKGAKP